jgi:transposase
VKHCNQSRNGSKYTTEKSRLVIEAMKEGVSIKEAALCVGVTRCTLYRWALKYRRFGREFRHQQFIRNRYRSVFSRMMRR